MLLLNSMVQVHIWTLCVSLLESYCHVSCKESKKSFTSKCRKFLNCKNKVVGLKNKCVKTNLEKSKVKTRTIKDIVVK